MTLFDSFILHGHRWEGNKVKIFFRSINLIRFLRKQVSLTYFFKRMRLKHLELKQNSKKLKTKRKQRHSWFAISGLMLFSQIPTPLLQASAFEMLWGSWEFYLMSVYLFPDQKASSKQPELTFRFSCWSTEGQSVLRTMRINGVRLSVSRASMDSGEGELWTWPSASSSLRF